MIRINLLAVEPRPATQPRVGAALGVPLACGGIITAVLGLVLWQALSIRSASNRLEGRIRTLDRELAGFIGVPARRAEVERQSAGLTRRVALTEAQRAARGAPVRMLDQMSRVLPDGVWLTGLRQQGEDITIEGRATGMTGVSDMVAGLESSGYFALPIEIVDSRPEAEASAEVVRFELRARLSLPAL